jgi:geranylgeranyl diphosphate synthase type II
MTSERLAEKALAILHEKSEKALKKAKELILQEKFRCEKAKEALKYYLSIWNDTTRPGLLVLAHEAVGGKPKEAVPLQTAMLFIDAAMDIHDDIIDKSITKGLKETLYGKFGKETALLIGNMFLVKGFNHLHKVTEKLSFKRKQTIHHTVKKFLFEVIDAHIKESELKDDKWNVKPTEYLKVIRQKAADIEGHMQIGAIFGGGSIQEVRALGMFGRCLGLLLTIRSDFIDIYEPDELINRIRHECLPLPLLYPLRNRRLRTQVQQIFSKEKLAEGEINTLLEIIYNSTDFSILKDYLDKTRQEALKSFNYLSKESIKDILTFLVSASLEDI